MNTYKRVITFKIDGEITKTHSWIVLIDDEEVNTEKKVEANGNTFESLWNYLGTGKHNLAIPANTWTRAFWSNKRRIEFFTKTKTWIDNGTEREWELYFEPDEKTKVSMGQILDFEEDRVTKYLKERGLTIR
jgi:hypothetical protein